MSAAVLVERLALTDEELLAIFQADPLDVIAGELDARPEVGILLTLTDDIDQAVLRRWLRAAGPAGRPLELLLRQDFAAFEDAVLMLRERGIVLRSGLQQTDGSVD